ncbi:molybdenum ABC transporter ATP-binding protein [Marinobacter zhanjiangensis]|uniref:Molybdenum import ATP-binding protein ModC n=1 Tax=Marinobacter zhanjiangensis TaxID=578215 RepID=A0ABQ3AKN0_9GAMM|nr:molybdenum ABC transporter ATP-binding protein [Marinobacter zhanjiangensis]GGY59737.1 molybdenum import ATP-binding protein ModC [Marinobacter zhanjiangensis]
MTLQVQARLQRGDFTLAINDTLPTEGITALYGRSGCGKTTLLRLIAGLERTREAEVRFRDQIWQSGRRHLPLNRRRLGLVFQESSLLPHLSVEANLRYGYQRTPPAQRRLHPEMIYRLLDLDDLTQQPVQTLSGGQRQRVALGRALLTSPQLMLLDEPLSALDTTAKREILPFLADLPASTGVPIMLVTHSAREVEQLADHVAFMSRGRLERIETLREALTRPDSPLFSDEGPAAVLQGQLTNTGDGEWQFVTRGGEGRPSVPFQVSGHSSHRTSLHRLRILASDVSLATQEPVGISIRNRMPVRIERIEEADEHRCTITCRLDDGQILLSRITRASVRELGLENGQTVIALVKSAVLME